MKQVINGLLFDTDKAQEVARDWDGHASDYHHWHETLYKTKSGRWFLACKGGPMSQHAKKTADGWTGDRYLKPISAPEALAWLERAGYAETALEHFSAQIEEA